MANDLINMRMVSSCNEYSILWQILSEDNPKIQKVKEALDKSSNLILETLEDWKRHPDLDRLNMPVKRDYAQFLSVILNRPKEGKVLYISYLENLKRSKFAGKNENLGQEILQKIHNLAHSQGLDEGENADMEFDFIDEQDNPRAVIGLENKSQVKILYCNSSFSSILGYVKSQLMKQPLTTIMSPD